MSVMLYPCMLCVALLMCLFVLCIACLTVFVNCLVKQFAMCLGVVAILYDVCENSVGSVYVGGYGGLRESRLCVFRELCPVSFLVIGESTSVLL